MRILLATSNLHKLSEVRAILAPTGMMVLGLGDVEGGARLAEPVEDAATFAGNARIKAAYYAKATGRICLADDSGLVVDALGGDPGVLSARYANEEVGEGGLDRDSANNAKLLRELAKLNLPLAERRARFVCALCLIDGRDGQIIAETEGYFEGLITDEARGENGFGYDPLLYLPDVDQTSAELSAADKNGRSHRGAALRELVEQLAAIKDALS